MSTTDNAPATIIADPEELKKKGTKRAAEEVELDVKKSKGEENGSAAVDEEDVDEEEDLDGEEDEDDELGEAEEDIDDEAEGDEEGEDEEGGEEDEDEEEEVNGE